MSTNKVPLTIEGKKKIQEELFDLKNNQRAKVIEDIAIARDFGDLSENAEYKAAREKQSFIEGRIIYLSDIISRAEVIDTSKFNDDRVRFGATVSIFDEDTEKEHKWQIVGLLEADIEKNKISYTAPIAKALIGKKVGDVVNVKTPKESKIYEIINVDYV